MNINFQLILIFYLACAFCQNFQISDGLSLTEIIESSQWFQMQAGIPYVRKFVQNDDIINAQKLNKKSKINVLEGIFIAQSYDPKEDLMISINGSQLQGRKPLIFIQYQPESQGYLCGEGSTICFIGKDVIQDKQKIYIIIQCSDSCEFEILAQYQLSKETIQNQKQLITMNFREYIKKLNFMVSLGGAKIKGFLLKVVFASSSESTFDMYIFQGSNYQSINDSLQNTLVTSSSGKIIKVEPNQGLASLKEYTLVLRSQQNEKFMITIDYIYYKEEIDIILNNKFSYALSENEQILLKANCGDISKLKSSVSIDLKVHEGDGQIYIDQIPYDQLEKYRFTNQVSNFQTYTLDKKYFVQKNTGEPHFYILIKAIHNLSFTIKIYLSDLKQKKSLDLNNLQYVIFQPSSELKYITYDLQFNLTKQMLISLSLQDLNLKAKKYGSTKSLGMIVKNCEESVKKNQKCKITPEEISNYSNNNLTDPQFIPAIQYSDGYTLKSTLIAYHSEYNQTNQKRHKPYSYNIAIVIIQSDIKNNNLTIFSLQTKQQQTLEKISQFTQVEQEIDNFQKKFYYFKVKNQFVEPQKKLITIYVQTQYGCIDVETSLENLLSSDIEAVTYFSSDPVVKSNRYQQLSQSSSIIDEYQNQFELDIDGDSYKEVYISVKGKSDSIYSFYVYSQDKNAPTFGNLRAIGDNIDYGRIYEDKLYDVSTMNTLNMYFPQTTSNIFIYYYLDYSDLNIERVKKDIKIMSHLKQRKSIKITPTIQLTDLQIGTMVQQDQYKVLEINDGLIYIETKNKKQQYYQLDILNNYSSNYNISIYYSILYTQSNYYYLKPGFKYYFTAEDNAPSQIAFFYARANTTIYFQLFACNGTFTFRQWSEKKKIFSQNINFTLENLQNLSLFIDKSDYYYLQFDLMKPQKQGQVILNLHMYYQDEYSPYDLIQVPDIQYQVKQDYDFLDIKFNYLALNKTVVENISEQIFTQSTPSIQSNNNTEAQKLQYILDFNNTKALKKQMNDFSSIKVVYYFQISNNQSHVSYCNPCFSIPRMYHSFYIMEKRSFNSQIEEINNFRIQKADILKAIQKYNPQQIVSIENSTKNSTMKTELYFSIMASLEIKDNLGQLSESYYFMYERQQVNLTYFNQTQVQSNLNEQKQIKTFHLALIICTIVLLSLLLISIICSFRIFRKGINLPCSCFMQQVYTDIPDSDSQSSKIKVRRLSNLNNLDGAFNQKARESIQEFLDIKRKALKSYSSPPPPTIEQ
ncbi:hypothetical protein ABPG74_009121 [Tetrahymena malaccensis]